MPAIRYPLARVPQLLFGSRRDPIGWLEALAREGDLVNIQFPSAPVYYAFHPDIIRECLATQQSSFEKGRGIQRLRLILGNSALTLEGEKHVKRRRALQPLFRQERLNEYANAIIERAYETTTCWRDAQIIDVANEMTRLTLAIASQVFLGLRLNSDEIASASTALSQVVDMFGVLMLPRGDKLVRLPLLSVKRFLAARDTLRSLARRAHSEIYSCIANGNDNAEYAIDELVTLLIAGHETTALMLTWAIYLLTQHPTVLEKARCDIERQQDSEHSASDSITRVPFLRAVLSETLRLYPPVWGIGRRTIEQVILDGEIIPEGAFVTISPWVIHRDARFYSAPDSFCPERWENGNPPPYAYIPFGGGARRCIGETFAWMEGALILATILPRWNFKPVSSPPDVKPGFTLRPRSPILIRVTQRAE